MPQNASEIRVAGTGRVLFAPPNTPPPANFTTDWAAPWADLGYTSAEGVKLVKKDKLDPIDTWQTVAAIRYVYGDRDLSVKFVLLQVNADTLPFFFGGGALASAGDGLAYEIAAAPQVTEHALAVEFRDGPTIMHRFVITRGLVTETDEMTLSRTAAVKLGLTFTALTPINTRSEPLALWTMNQTSPTTAAVAASEVPAESKG
jgi:hypothetical protein